METKDRICDNCRSHASKYGQRDRVGMVLEEKTVDLCHDCFKAYELMVFFGTLPMPVMRCEKCRKDVAMDVGYFTQYQEKKAGHGCHFLCQHCCEKSNISGWVTGIGGMVWQHEFEAAWNQGAENVKVP